MKNKIKNIVLALAVTAISFSMTAVNASAATVNKGWNVTYNGTEMTTDYDLDKATIEHAMPGDTLAFAISYTNDTKEALDFYLNTAVITSLEDDETGEIAAGGAYSYKLSYVLDGAETIIYDSDTIGGDNDVLKGLKQIQGDNPEDTYFSLGRVAAGDSGVVNLVIKLDGNSQDNGYMAKLATMNVSFGVEKIPQPVNKTVKVEETKKVVYTTPGGTEIVMIDDPIVPLNGPQTGDSALPIIICSVSMMIGFMLIGLYFYIMRKSREEVA
jgi:hypothetical protein